MKKNKYLFVCAAFGAMIALQSSARLNPNNPPLGHTGAPSEETCGKVGCHSGGTYTGSVSISGVPDTIMTGATYTITLTLSSNAVRGGFQLTCLDANNTKCGTLTAGTGVNVAGTTRQYARQSAPKTLANGSTSWTFQWTAPTTVPGNTATFYYNGLGANGNGEKTGDKVFLGSKQVRVAVPNNAAEAFFAPVQLYPNPVVNTLLIENPTLQPIRAQLFDAKGMPVATAQLNDRVSSIDVSQLPSGNYIVQLQAGAHQVARQVMIKH